MLDLRGGKWCHRLPVGVSACELREQREHFMYASSCTSPTQSHVCLYLVALRVLALLCPLGPLGVPVPQESRAGPAGHTTLLLLSFLDKHKARSPHVAALQDIDSFQFFVTKAKTGVPASEGPAYHGVQGGLFALVVLQSHLLLLVLHPQEALGLQGTNHLFFLVHQGHLEGVIGKYMRQKIG